MQPTTHHPLPNYWPGARLAACLALLMMACGPNAQFQRARKLEGKGKFYKAWELYQEFAAAHPHHDLAPKALFRAGLLAQTKFEDCYMAGTFFDSVLARYPQADPWARAALLQKINCPDYFPLYPGSTWTEGDSDTKGKNARIEIVCERLAGDKTPLPSERGVLSRSYYAGVKTFQVLKTLYRKEQGELRESKAEDPLAQVLLKWPLEIGTRWDTRAGGKIFHHEVVTLNQLVQVAAGTFGRCLLVRSTTEGDGAVKNDYFAPGVGRILTSISTKAGEKRITELLSYKIAEAPFYD